MDKLRKENEKLREENYTKNENNTLKMKENEQDLQDQKHMHELLEKTFGSMKAYYNNRFKEKESVQEIRRGNRIVIEIEQNKSKEILENKNVTLRYGDILIKMEDEDLITENEESTKEQSLINNSNTLKRMNFD